MMASSLRVLWDDVKNPKGVIQIVHGMTAYEKGIQNLAKFYTLGYIAYGDDHCPHGKQQELENIGKAGKSSFFESVLDANQITKMLKAGIICLCSCLLTATALWRSLI